MVSLKTKKEVNTKTCAEVWSGIKDQIEKINGSKSGEYEKNTLKLSSIQMMICV